MGYEIYCITNKTNNKSYVGQSIDANERWKDHIYDAKRQIGKTAINKKYPIHNAIAKYGETGFIWQIIDQCDTIEEANELEEFYIAYLQTLAPNGYNLLPGGNNRTLLESSKKKISNTLKKTSWFIGRKGADHPNYGTTQSEDRKREQSLRSSGDDSNGKKINSQTARQLYLDYLHDTTISMKNLVEKYGIKKSAICNILHKKCWKEATKDLPDIDFSIHLKSKYYTTDL
jgi:group I intron endonuclease